MKILDDYNFLDNEPIKTKKISIRSSAEKKNNSF